MGTPEFLGKLSAKCVYLLELQRHNIITPSIARPYPESVTDNEKLILHRSYRKIQQGRIDNIRNEISHLKESHIDICWKTYVFHKNRLQNKIDFLLNKFKPFPFVNERRRTKKLNQKKLRNRKSRERYKARTIKKRIKEYIDNPECRTVFNLSSQVLQIGDLMALELGHGFVPTPDNPKLEEDILIAEGIRFIDRVVKLDKDLNDNTTVANNGTEVPCVRANTNSSTETNEHFIRSKNIPIGLQFFQPQETQVTHAATKVIMKEFDLLNNKLISDLQPEERKQKIRNKKRRFNMSKKMNESLSKFKKLVKDHIIDIRKVDKGQTILIIDYNERRKAEMAAISTIATLCDNQTPNWEHNKYFIEQKMKDLFHKKMISKNELTAVTGLIAGGISGELKNGDGSIKFTRAINNNELFVRQRAAYVYPLFKCHKIPFKDLLTIQSNEVNDKIPSRLVVGMGSVQLSRVQSWLEHFLTPLSNYYGKFELIKDSNDMLMELENIKVLVTENNLNWDDLLLFTIDVKALYPSVKFEYLSLALRNCFQTCTLWNDNIIDILIEIIIYTLSNQQLVWDSRYYMIDQGIPTGGKHSVPLANILLTYIMLNLLDSNPQFKASFISILKLWKRFIDDCMGIFQGNFEHFSDWFNVIRNHFHNFELDLTYDTDSHNVTNSEPVEKEIKGIQFLDMEIFKEDNCLHTREYRKETSSQSYLKYSSAHPRHVFSGIVKSQMYRIRRLCSRDIDYHKAIDELQLRCLKSGYPHKMLLSILSEAPNIIRSLTPNRLNVEDGNKHKLRLITLSGTNYENEFSTFVSRINSIMTQYNIRIELVKTNHLSIGRILFNNCDQKPLVEECERDCYICVNGLNSNKGSIKSKVTNLSYKVDSKLTCNNAGIYVVSGACGEQYTGKTTTTFMNRTKKHLNSNDTSVSAHRIKCTPCKNIKDCDITFVEHYHSRGKYTLSERELVWNKRIKGSINIQKTLKS